MDLQNIIRSTMNSSHEERPTVDELLHLPRVQAILQRRHRLKSLKRLNVSVAFTMLFIFILTFHSCSQLGK